MCPSYKFVVMFIRPIFDSPKSVSLMCPMEVINKLQGKKTQKPQIINLRYSEKHQRLNVSETSAPTSERLPVFKKLQQFWKWWKLWRNYVLPSSKDRRNEECEMLGFSLLWLVEGLLVRFEVSVYDAIIVKVLQRQDSLCKIQPCHVHRQRTNVLQKVCTVPTFKYKGSQHDGHCQTRCFE